MLLIAIDPGANGGIAFSDGDSTKAIKMPETPKDILNGLDAISINYADVRCVIEKVGFHVQGNSASSSCKFARHCGHVEMALIALGIPFSDVTPQKWMKWLGALPSDKTARKNAIKDKMQRLHPDIRVTLWNSDALALLEWAKKNA